ncbi:MAG: xanthine dehydrogenase molybdopterin binding subunit [Thiofilum sp.]|uniref:xanthine dehydrogenase molybdopterin binding subunit n=1 Tax=Thiofilum sp. TaxID=2212733 RepID=UPI0025DDDA40|nr:xanthine dehydrogenase molybdopterin binding subunit [Thiofilum sp.]MBK8455106.1 xanthine dehydrogenase molybdopterin binding subunit [Thiofilum sp.]
MNQGHAGQAVPHDSARRHVSGAALYVDDIPLPLNTLHAMVGGSTCAAGQITALDLSAVKASTGVKAVLTLDDVPGHKDIGPVFPGDPLLSTGEILFYGQPIFVVAADTYQHARIAARKAKIEYAPQTPLLDVKQALSKQCFVRPTHSFGQGDAEIAIQAAPIQLSGEQYIGGQEHFYLEGQVSLALPTEDGVMVYSSTQHPSELQKLVAEVLHLPIHAVTVEMRRMGGGFGGKETQAAQWACLAALLAIKTKQAVKLRLPRADDMSLTGKRHPFWNQYNIGCDNEGKILGATIQVVGECGYSPDLSDAIVDRAMFHSDNAYHLPNAHIVGQRCFTNTVSHTAFRGFGGPQGMMIIEQAMDDIARRVGKDPLEVRKLNLYQEQQTTPYGQTIEYFVLSTIIEQLEHSSEYWRCRAEVKAFNQTSSYLKKGLSLTPVKFGISFTVQHLNQAGALIHIYTDGSIHLNHGGTEMGQGLNTKVAQVVATEFGVDLDRVLITATRTDKVPNTSPTAASSGADLNGKAAQNAAQMLKARMAECIATEFNVPVESVEFANNQVRYLGGSLSFAQAANLAYMRRVSLSTTGYYKTPMIHYDRKSGKGHPFFYYAMGAAVSEVQIDTLTGEYKVLRVDILHDVGASLNPALDKGQIEGALIQGMGWLTTEELMWNQEGRLLSNSPATYKIPAISDTPPIFNVAILKDHPNSVPTIYHSKAVGEPPFMLAISVWSALRDAISSLSEYKISPKLDTPATPERVLRAVIETRAALKA